MTYQVLIVNCRIKKLKYSILKLHKLLKLVIIFQEVEEKGISIYHKYC